MNTTLRRTSVLVLILFALLFAQITRVQFIDQDFYANNQHNNRLLIDQYAVPRGAIYAEDTVIAHSVDTGADRLRYEREYPEGSEWGNITGFISPTFGRTNLEQAQNSILTGQDSQFFFQRVQDTFTGADTLGGNLILHVQPDLQEAAYQELADSGVNGGIMMLEPTTGAILAQASYPGWNPTGVASNNYDQATEAWADINEASGNPALDRTRSDFAAPGSTFKTIVAAALVRDHGYDAETMVPAGNSYGPPDTEHTITNAANQCPESELPLREAFARSCNTTFAQLCVDELGTDELDDMARELGLGEEFETPLPTVASELGDIDSPALRAQSCIGQQDVRMTVTQNAMIAAAMTNNGEVMEPSLVAEVQDQNGNTLQRPRPSSGGNPLNAEQSQQMQRIMTAVVEDGTGGNANVSGHTVGGKTGTAENTDSDGDRRPNHGWFIGWAHDDDGQPAVAIAVFLANYGDNASTEAANISGNLMDRYLNG